MRVPAKVVSRVYRHLLGREPENGGDKKGPSPLDLCLAVAYSDERKQRVADEASLQSQIECVFDVLRSHVSAELPSDDVSAVIVQDRAEIEPSPAQNLQIRWIAQTAEGGGG